MRKLLFALMLLTSIPAFAQNTYYTAKLCSGGTSPPNCNNANNGTSRATAELTIAAGLAHLATGDTLIIGDGTYDEQFLTPVAGSLGAHTIIRAENRNLAIVKPTALGPSGYTLLFDLPNSYVTIDGIDADCTNLTMSCAPLYAQYTTAQHHNTYQNGKAHGARGDGTGPGQGSCVNPGPGGNNIVLNMDIYDCGLSVNADHGIYLKGSNNTVDGNRITSTNPNGGAGNPGGAVVTLYDVNGPQSGNIIRNNTIYSNGTLAIELVADSDTLVYNNVIYSNGWTADSNYSGVGFYTGTFTNVGIYFNTIYANKGWCIGATGGGSVTISSNSIFRNNICYSNLSGAIDPALSAATASNNLTTDPSFFNASIGNFHLTTGSAAIPPCGVAVAGIAGTADKDGITRPNPPSCGAYEAPSGSNPLDPLAETFESYSAATSIGGLNGGGGWTQSWTLSAGVATVETAGCSLTGKALRINSTSQVNIERHFTAHTGNFSVLFKMCSSITNPDGSGVGVELLNQAGSTAAAAFFNSAGNIVTHTQTISAFSANTACTVELNFDTALHPNEYRSKACGGAYTSWEPTLASFTGIASLAVGNYSTNAHTFWLDDISEVVGGGSGTITGVTPATGTKCVSGSTCTISWASNGITGNVDIYYLVGGNQYLIASPAYNATPYSWTVNAPASTSAQVRVSQGSVTDDSDAFTIYGTKVPFK